MLERLWIYQRERFPLAPLALLAAALGAGATMYSARSAGAAPASWATVLAAAASALAFFAQMRVLDEFKDFADDARYRPYRPLPRGLVSRRELQWILIIAAVSQVAIAAVVDNRLLALLAALWAYLALMTVEFFAPEWLRARPFAYLASHVPFGGLIALYAAAFEWLPRAHAPHATLLPFVLAGVFCTALLEIGRKIRAPGDEETGVDTYSAVWGRSRAVATWLVALALLVACGLMVPGLVIVIVVAAAIAAGRYLYKPETPRAKALEALSGVTALAFYTAVALGS